MPGFWLVIILGVVSVACSAFATVALIPVLRRVQILDHPNDRSSHVAPTPRGAGLALVPIVAIGWAAAAVWVNEPVDLTILWCVLGALLLCALSWLDDMRGLSPLIRLGAHGFVVAALLSLQPAETLYAQGLLPLWADRLVAGFIWLWFINLFNFMDGIDGISGIETLSIGVGLIVLALGAASLSPSITPAAVLAGAALGFLFLNWHPAKIFLGDSGSVPLGLLLGWLLLDLAAKGFWAAAVILPLYYLADATITIFVRILRGEKIWQAHRQHFYQRAVAGGSSHSQVVAMIGIANVGLIALALLSVNYEIVALIGAAFIVIVLLFALQRRAVAT